MQVFMNLKGGTQGCIRFAKTRGNDIKCFNLNINIYILGVLKAAYMIM